MMDLADAVMSNEEYLRLGNLLMPILYPLPKDFDSLPGNSKFVQSSMDPEAMLTVFSYSSENNYPIKHYSDPRKLQIGIRVLIDNTWEVYTMHITGLKDIQENLKSLSEMLDK